MMMIWWYGDIALWIFLLTCNSLSSYPCSTYLYSLYFNYLAIFNVNYCHNCVRHSQSYRGCGDSSWNGVRWRTRLPFTALLACLRPHTRVHFLLTLLRFFSSNFILTCFKLQPVELLSVYNCVIELCENDLLSPGSLSFPQYRSHSDSRLLAVWEFNTSAMCSPTGQ